MAPSTNERAVIPLIDDCMSFIGRKFRHDCQNRSNRSNPPGYQRTSRASSLTPARNTAAQFATHVLGGLYRGSPPPPSSPQFAGLSWISCLVPGFFSTYQAVAGPDRESALVKINSIPLSSQASSRVKAGA